MVIKLAPKDPSGTYTYIYPVEVSIKFVIDKSNVYYANVFMTYLLTDIECMFKLPGLTVNYSKVEYKILFELSFKAYYIYYV